MSGAHRLAEANRRDGTHCRMAGPLLVEFTVENGQLALVAPRTIGADDPASHRRVRA